MSENDGELVTELNHKINSPLAAIRYAMYLAGKRSSDPVLLRYLRVAEDEVQSIADILRQARQLAQQAGGRKIRNQSADQTATEQGSPSASPSNKKTGKDQKAAA